MSSEHCILACGRDPALLETRRLVLESSGYRVHTATEIAAAIQILLSEAVELTILCHTFSGSECLAALAAVHSSHPEAKILLLQASRAVCETGDGIEVANIFEGPHKFIQKVQELIATPRQKRANQLSANV